uniref:Kinesin motor domain-containing protein n=1 Tax=Oryza punctata TaxID=4537 RepID=A0A0E0KQP8_ORYPU
MRLTIILDVPSVWGRLMLVDMAGSEDIEAAGQTGFEAKMQARLEVMGKKAKNATYISGNEAGKISREVAKEQYSDIGTVEKYRRWMVDKYRRWMDSSE